MLHQPPPLQADYVWYGPRERALNETWQPDPAWTPVYARGAVSIYELSSPQQAR